MRLKTSAWLLLAGALMACQPAVQPPPPDDPAVRAQLEPGRIAIDGEQGLPLKSWLPQQDAPLHAVILALHGFNDYSHAFDLPGRAMAAHGVGVYAYDQRGFGASAQPGIWPGLPHLARDVKLTLQALKAEHPKTPLYLLGESMGGAVVMNACAQQEICADVDGLILVAPAIWGDDTFSGFQRASLSVLAHLIPSSEWTGEDLDIQASDNIEILYAMGADPLVIKQTRVDAVYGLVKLMADACESAPALRRPILLLYGAKDEIVAPLPVAKAINLLQAPYSIGYYENGYHMLLRDHQREVVYKDILSWIDNRYRPLPSSADMGWKEELLGVQ